MSEEVKVEKTVEQNIEAINTVGELITAGTYSPVHFQFIGAVLGLLADMRTHLSAPPTVATAATSEEEAPKKAKKK